MSTHTKYDVTIYTYDEEHHSACLGHIELVVWAVLSSTGQLLWTAVRDTKTSNITLTEHRYNARACGPSITRSISMGGNAAFEVVASAIRNFIQIETEMAVEVVTISPDISIPPAMM